LLWIVDTSANPFSQLSGYTNRVGLLCARCREAGEGESCEAEIFVEDREAVDPLAVSLDETSEG
jgi:hypothetical protein